MDEIRPNSHKYKESVTEELVPSKKLQPVVSEGKARTHKKSGFSKIAGNIISEDAKNVKSYILMDVLIPTCKKAISDIVTNGIDIMLYGETGHTKRNNANRVSYRQYFDNTTDRFGRGGTTRYDGDPIDRGRTRDDRSTVTLFDDVEVDSMGEAKDIISRMSEYLEAYPVISVADMYDLAGITTFPHTYNNYGWKSVVDAKIERVKDGYCIKMPPVMPLK